MENLNVMYIAINKVTKIYLSLFHVVEQLGLIASYFLDQRLSHLLCSNCSVGSRRLCAQCKQACYISIPCSLSLLMEQDLWAALQVSGSRMCK